MGLSKEKQEKPNQEAVTISGYGFKVVVNGNEKLQITKEDDTPVVDMMGRIDAYNKLVKPMFDNVNTAWTQELTATTEASGKMEYAQDINVDNNDNVKKELGQKMDDGSYYMGISKDTGTDFYLFIESAGQSKTADVVSWNHATTDLEQTHKDNVEFKGHKYSEFQTESNIIASYKNGTADGGLRRLTKAEWGQVEKVFEENSELRELAKEVCKKDNRVQTASEYGYGLAWFQSLQNGEQYNDRRNDVGSVLVGRSAAKKNDMPKPV